MFMYKDYKLVWNGNPVVYSVYCNSGGVCVRVVNTSNSGSGGPGFKRRPSRCFLTQGTLLYLVSLHSGCISGYRQHTAGGNPVMD